MEAPNPYPRSARAAAARTSPGGIAAAIAAGVAALACFLPWYRIDLAAMTSALGESFRGATGAAMPLQDGFGNAMSGMLSGLGVSGTITATGVDSWVGVVVLVAMAAAATLQLIADTAAPRESRGAVLVMAVVASILGAGFSLYAVTQLGGPVGIHIGLVATVIGASAATVMSVRRMQLAASWSPNGQLAA